MKKKKTIIFNVSPEEIKTAGYFASLNNESPDEFLANTAKSIEEMISSRLTFLWDKINEEFPNDEFQRNHIFLEIAALLNKNSEVLDNALSKILQNHQKNNSLLSSRDIDNALKDAAKNAAKT